ncbi:polymorphic toxin type 44 domain-containing protein [Hymenobacter terrenus]|uniref:polymorphic toxin type 44 domain-containing protein n=1 Tax=Hymenobacter terrenus TaxID=1629124 RepID=UPI000619FE08|nr:polymorphic toxin type 44 domain-containing protein [Hymenobacter terrenus]
MPLFASKPQSVSAWAAVVHAGNLDLIPAEPAGSLAPVLVQGANEQRAQKITGWFDVEFINFSADTWQFINITEGDLRTALRHRTYEVGKLLYTFGAVKEEFRFADPVDDIEKIKRGIIRSLRPVTEAEILKMLTHAGVFDYNNKTAHTPLLDRWTFIKKEGQGGGRLDFSMSGLKMIAKMTIDYTTGEELTPFLFYLEGVAHNWFNFGNFLFGAAGAALGFTKAELLNGAEYNSLVNYDKNGYDPQFDSADDQFSITLGFEYATKRNYASRVVRRWGVPRRN